MDYTGELYGKMGRKYFLMKLNTKDVDELESTLRERDKRIEWLEAGLEQISSLMGTSGDLYGNELAMVVSLKSVMIASELLTSNGGTDAKI